MKARLGCIVLGFLSLGLFVSAQTTTINTPTSSASAAVSTAAPNGAPALSGGGTKNYVPLWLSSSRLGNSKLFQSTAGEIGLGTTTPAATLDVNGTVNAATSFNLGGSAFAFGSVPNLNAFLGFAGNATNPGAFNTAIGVETLLSNTASYNTAIGAQALYYNTTGTGNTATGAQALWQNFTGFSNTATGEAALLSNQTGSYNTATGEAAMWYNNSGTDNTATGEAALYSNTTGGYNTATGAQALLNNLAGASNTADGYEALYKNTGGANTANGYEALYSNDTGNDNTASGLYALYSNVTGNYNTALGYLADVGGSNLQYATAIGSGAKVSESNALVLGGALGSAASVKVGIGTATPANVFTIAQGAGSAIADGWTTYSSRRWKTNIQTLQGALGKVEQLRGVSYDLKDSGKHQIGVIGEEVGTVVPEVVSYEENGKDARSVDYSRLTALLIEATKEQQQEIQELRSELQATRQTLQKVQAQVAAAQPALVAAK